MKIAIALCTNRGVKAKTVESLLKLEIPYEKEIILATEGYTIAENRNYCVAKALNAGCSHLLFIDDDMTFPPDTLKRLLAHEQQIVGVASCSRMLPLRTTVELQDGSVPTPDQMPKELFEVKAVGCGVILIDTEVFHEIGYPFFGWELHLNGAVKRGEDAWFCDKARERNIPIYCDPTITIGHIGDYSYGA